jgi:hypothetical protein
MDDQGQPDTRTPHVFRHDGKDYVSMDEYLRLNQRYRDFYSPRWVSVEERLPESGETIWGFDGEEPFLCEYSVCGFQTYGASCDREGLNSETLFGVTHWMEVACPESPKED